MKDDIAATFRETYLGNYRNSRDNQMMLVNALNSSYFRQLMQQTILDPDYANAAMIDVDAQRAAWVASGKSEAAELGRRHGQGQPVQEDGLPDRECQDPELDDRPHHADHDGVTGGTYG